MNKEHNQFSNRSKVMELSEVNWDLLEAGSLSGIAAEQTGKGYLRTKNHDFINMASFSYLGLDVDDRILASAKDAIDKMKALHISTARVRIHMNMLEQLEEKLSKHFSCETMIYVSCSSATSAFLPLLASGLVTDGEKPLLIFDKHCHFCMKHVIPICGDETEIVIAPHNDINFIENYCKTHTNVAYIGDGTYSMGDHTPIKDLIELQKRYNLFIYLDDSHGLSITHPLGWGYTRGTFPEVNERTVIVSSFVKGFGASGGMLMFANSKIKKLLFRYGNAWSQQLNSAGLGAIEGSLKIHESPDLKKLQEKLWSNVNLFDRLTNSQNTNSQSTVRVLSLPSPSEAIQAAEKLFKKGFYLSPVFFPIVPKGKAGLRVMLRANHSEENIRNLCHLINNEEVLIND